MEISKRTRSVALGLAALTVFAGAACSSRGGDEAPGTSAQQTVAQVTETPSNASPQAQTSVTTNDDDLSTEELVELAQPAVVRVAVPGGVGSGFIVDSDGYIVTNNHVVESGLGAVEVTLADGSRYPAEVVGTDPRVDIAVLKIETGHELPALELADLDTVNVGEDVVAIGYALDLSDGRGDPSVTRGIISGKNRTIPTNQILGAVQTDAAINHGNSGGPLLDYQGRVVGVNTALAPDPTTNSLAQNIGLAVGSDMVTAVYEELLRAGTVQRAYLGIGGFAAIRPAEAEALGLDRDTEGILVAAGGVAIGSPAAQGGMQDQDVIVRVGDYDIADESDLAVAMTAYDPGNTVDIDVMRGGEEVTLSVTLGEASAQ